MIAFSDTSVDRKANLYRFQIEEFPDYDIMRLYENKGRRGNDKRVKTIYDNEGYAWSVSTVTGEILRRKRPIEIKRCVDTSIQRSRKVLREIVMANKWQWFVTLTFNDIEQNRMDDEEVFKQFAKFRKDIRKRYPDMYYVAVPERHKNECIHFHLLVGGMTKEQLRLVYSGKKDEHGREIFNSHAWRYGFSTVTEVGDSEKVSGYILKYVGKDCGISEVSKKRYWASKNCNRPRKRFVDIICDMPIKVKYIFDSMVERTLCMVVDFYHKMKNYIAVKDFCPQLRKLRFPWDRFNDSAHDDFWRVPRGGRKVLTL